MIFINKIPYGGFYVGDDFAFESKTLHLSEEAKAWTKDHLIEFVGGEWSCDYQKMRHNT